MSMKENQDKLTISEFLNSLSEVYDENKEDFLNAQNKPQLINYLMGKLMIKTKGKVNPVLALTIFKAVVNSDLPNNRKLKTK